MHQFRCYVKRLLSRKFVIRILQWTSVVYVVKLIVYINQPVGYSLSADNDADHWKHGDTIRKKAILDDSSWAVRKMDNTSGQLVIWKNTTINVDRITSHNETSQQIKQGAIPAPWNLLQGMALYPNLSMPENQNIYYRRQQYKVNQFEYPFDSLPRDLCSHKTHLIVLIHSRADFIESRRALRETWVGAARDGDWPGHSGLLADVKVVFVIASYGNSTLMESVRKESREENDIVLCGFKDSYYNMTIKSMMGLRFVAEECPQARFLLKMDDDVILNMPYLLSILHKESAHDLLLGPINPSSKVGRDWGKWAVPRRIYPFARYPPYLSGAAYVISADLAPRLVALAPYIPAFHVDDAYVTGVLAKAMNIKPRGKPGFAYWGSPIPTVCKLVKNKIITGSKVKGPLRRELWNKLLDPTERKKC